MYVILVYDIRLDDTGPRIWRNVFKICKKYLHHIQNSVFEGELTKAQIMQLNVICKNIFVEIEIPLSFSRAGMNVGWKRRCGELRKIKLLTFYNNCRPLMR